MWHFSVWLVSQDEVSYVWITLWKCRMFVIEHCVNHRVQIQNVCVLGSKNCLNLVLSVVSCHKEALVYVS
jgi:hypothetical protein